MGNRWPGIILNLNVALNKCPWRFEGKDAQSRDYVTPLGILGGGILEWILENWGIF